MSKRLLTFFLVIVLLNGALFNRIGFRIAEQSYIIAVLKTILVKTTNGKASFQIKISKRVVPGQTSGSQTCKGESQQTLFNQLLKSKFELIRTVQKASGFPDLQIPLLNAIIIRLIKPPI